MGRSRGERWGPRNIDLDLLLFDEQIVRAKGLQTPHPRMAYRRFVLEPAAEVAPEMKHPIVGWTMQQLLDHLNQSPYALAVGGDDAQTVRAWSELLADRFDATLFDSSDAWRQCCEHSGSSIPEPSVIAFSASEPSQPDNVRLTVLLSSNPEADQPSGWTGPVLMLSADSPNLQQEITAAMEAMR